MSLALDMLVVGVLPLAYLSAWFIPEVESYGLGGGQGEKRVGMDQVGGKGVRAREGN